jgi:hypothetical protein
MSMHPDQCLFRRVPPPRRSPTTALGTALLVLAGVLVQGCVVSKGEYGDFVKASRGFYDAVGPAFSEATVHDVGLSDQSKKNRLSELEAYKRALEAAEDRVK